jgi:hypothetical protein
MMPRLLLIVTALLMIAILAAAMPVQAQGGDNPRLVFQATVPDVSEIKFPDIAAADRTVHISANTDREDASYWTKGDTAQSFGNRLRLGEASGQADFSSTAIAVGPDGRVHYIWINQPDRTIYHRSKPAGGDWGPRRVAVSGTAFPANPDSAVDSNGRIYVAWRDPDAPMKVTYSDNNGTSWSTAVRPSPRTAVNFPSLATGPNGSAILTYTMGENDLLQIFAGFWNGSNFDLQRITPLNDDWADPTATIAPDGTAYVTWRAVAKSGPNSGIYLATNSGGSASWSINQIVENAETFGTSNIDADPDGNLHLSWNAQAGIGQRVYYSYRAVGESFSAPISAPNSAGLIFNSRISSNVGEESYGHVIGEMFVGDNSFLRYILFAAPAAGQVGATPVIEDDADIIGRSDTVDVNFIDVRGEPTQVRWRWNAEPNDTENDSGGWVTYSDQISINVPAEILDAEGCAPTLLYTQVRNAEQITQTPAGSDSVIIDGGISAVVGATNPYLDRRADRFTDAAINDYNSDGGANDGAVNYTRAPIFYLELIGNGDCSGLQDVATGRSTQTIAPPFQVEEEYFANVLPIPGLLNPGENTLIVRVGDNAGNFADYLNTFIYDTNAPIVANPGSATITSDPRATILTQIDVSGAQVSDDYYPGRGFWGVWITNSRTPIADPASDDTLFWRPLPAPGDSGTFTISNWSLATGLNPDELTPGSYYVYIRYLDGAGNPSAGYLTATVNLDTVTRPPTYLPLMMR